MKIAVTYEDGLVFGHFGKTRQFKMYETDGEKVLTSQVVETGGSGHSALAGFLRQHGVQQLICGGIGAGARTALAEAGIQLFPGVTGLADAAVEALLAGRLDYQPDIQCDHHHEGEHTCGEHGCGSR